MVKSDVSSVNPQDFQFKLNQHTKLFSMAKTPILSNFSINAILPEITDASPAPTPSPSPSISSDQEFSNDVNVDVESESEGNYLVSRVRIYFMGKCLVVSWNSVLFFVVEEMLACGLS